MRRFFSVSAPAAREFAHVVRRRWKQPRQLQVGDPDTLLKREVSDTPPYPYGESHIYKQSNRGLYGGKIPQYGHKISEWGNKHVRVFHPNVQRVSLWSDALKRTLRLKVVTSVLRTITKEKGLDNYLLKDTSARIKELGPTGWRLRFLVLKKMELNEQLSPKAIGNLSDGSPYYAVVNGQAVFVGRSRLVKELSRAVGKPLRQVYAEHRASTPEELLKALGENGVDTSQYLRAME